MAQIEISNKSLFAETGTTGLPAFNGRYAERYSPELQGPEGINRMALILRREPAAFVVNHVVTLTAQQATWTATPASDAPADRAAATFVDQCLADMSHSFWKAVEFALTSQALGFADLYIVYKRRAGRNPKSDQPSSNFNDGLIGLRKLAIRRQETIDEWDIDENGSPRAMIQIDPSTGRRMPPVPIERLLHFVGGNDRGSWEGVGWLEPAYDRRHIIQSLEIIYGVGQQRAFVGLPVFKYTAKPDTDSRLMVEKMLKALVVNEQAYVTYPGQVGEFSLLTVTNANAAELRENINQQRWEIQLLGLAHYLRLGSTASGSQALANPLLDLFRAGVNAINANVADVFNRHLIPRLFALNPSLSDGITDLPKLTPSSVSHLGPEVIQWIGSIQTFLSAAAPEDSLWLRSLIGMPKEVTIVKPPTKKEPDKTVDSEDDADDDTPKDETLDDGEDTQASAPLTSIELLHMQTATAEFAKAAIYLQRNVHAQPHRTSPILG